MSVTSGKDARRLVILKGDLENSGDRGSLVKEDIARKYISYFHSILHHNNGYFCLVMKAYMYQLGLWPNFLQFLLCEILNLVVDIVNIYLTDFFLSGRFMKWGGHEFFRDWKYDSYIIVRYGSQVVQYLSYDQIGRLARPNPMCTVFPTITRLGELSKIVKIQ